MQNDSGMPSYCDISALGSTGSSTMHGCFYPNRPILSPNIPKRGHPSKMHVDIIVGWFGWMARFMIHRGFIMGCSGELHRAQRIFQHDSRKSQFFMGETHYFSAPCSCVFHPGDVAGLSASSSWCATPWWCCAHCSQEPQPRRAAMTKRC